MPYSELEKFDWCMKKIKSILKPYRYLNVIDVGAGAGLYEDYMRRWGFRSSINLAGIEVWPEYIKEFNLEERYDEIICEEAQIFDFNWYKKINECIDLVIFGDVLEHMSVADAVNIWNEAGEFSYHRLLAIPTVYYPQGHIHNNPYEVHVKEDWTHEEVLDTFKGITDYSPQYPYTRAYWA